MARAGSGYSATNIKNMSGQANQAYNTGQNAIANYTSDVNKLKGGQNVGADPFQNPNYLGNVNRLQANALDAATNAGKFEMAQNDRATGGLNAGTTKYGIANLALQKARLGDTLSSQRAAEDYRSNLDWQKGLAANDLAPAATEVPYYETGTQGTLGSTKNLTDIGNSTWQNILGLVGAGAQAGAQAYTAYANNN